VRGIVILQCRTTSRRLPAKVLLPIGGFPIAVLAAKRAANTGREVIVATSSEPEDDALVRQLESHDLRVIRGSLDDVLSRFATALGSIENERVVFRLTADNVFPDGALLDEIEKAFDEKKLQYMSCSGSESGLPYGLSAEVTTAGEIRESAARALSAYDREHVTPAIIRKYGAHQFTKYSHLACGSMRCTVDNLDDYLRVEKVFNGISEPVLEPWISLVEKLRCIEEDNCGNGNIASKIVLGTAQWGAPYGITNVTGIPNKRECRAILKTALENGITSIDTARAYGKSEQVFGEASMGMEGRFNIMTKLSPLQECPREADVPIVEAFVDASIMTSCRELGAKTIDVVMLHRAEHLHTWQSSAWLRLIKLKSRGIIGRLGVSVQTPDELETALEEEGVEHIQMPWNVLDWRWDDIIPKIRKTKASREITIHARSTLLQGLLANKEPDLWKKAHIPDAAPVINWLELIKSDTGHKDLSGFCIGAALEQDWIDGVVVGMETLAQLLQNLLNTKTPKIQEGLLQKIKETRPILPEKSLNPALWQS